MDEINDSFICISCLLSGVYLKCLSKFIVDAKDIDTKGEEEVAAIITTPDNQRFASEVLNKHDGTYLVTYSALMEGNLC